MTKTCFPVLSNATTSQQQQNKMAGPEYQP